MAAKVEPMICVVKVDAWKCSDGTVHPTQDSALHHERGLQRKQLSSEAAQWLDEISFGRCDAGEIIEHIQERYDLTPKDPK